MHAWLSCSISFIFYAPIVHVEPLRLPEEETITIIKENCKLVVELTGLSSDPVAITRYIVSYRGWS